MTIALLYIGTFLLIVVLASIITNFISVGGPLTYRRAFEDFKKADFERTAIISKDAWEKSGGQISTPDRQFIWFTDEDTFKVGDWTYVRCSFPFCLDPLNFYWWKQFKRYAEENLDHEYLNEDSVNGRVA